MTHIKGSSYHLLHMLYLSDLLTYRISKLTYLLQDRHDFSSVTNEVEAKARWPMPPNRKCWNQVCVAPKLPFSFHITPANTGHTCSPTFFLEKESWSPGHWHRALTGVSDKAENTALFYQETSQWLSHLSVKTREVMEHHENNVGFPRPYPSIHSKKLYTLLATNYSNTLGRQATKIYPLHYSNQSQVVALCLGFNVATAKMTNAWQHNYNCQSS